MTISTRQAEVRAVLERVLDGCEKPDVRATTSELRSAGIPVRYAPGIATASIRCTSREELDALLDSYSLDVARHVERQDTLTPDEIAARVPRI